MLEFVVLIAILAGELGFTVTNTDHNQRILSPRAPTSLTTSPRSVHPCYSRVFLLRREDYEMGGVPDQGERPPEYKSRKDSFADSGAGKNDDQSSYQSSYRSRDGTVEGGGGLARDRQEHGTRTASPSLRIFRP